MVVFHRVTIVMAGRNSCSRPVQKPPSSPATQTLGYLPIGRHANAVITEDFEKKKKRSHFFPVLDTRWCRDRILPNVIRLLLFFFQNSFRWGVVSVLGRKTRKQIFRRIYSSANRSVDQLRNARVLLTDIELDF